MQREIASVMAACGLRNIRYVTFPPVVFATPEPLPEAEAAPVVPEAAPEVMELACAPVPLAAEVPVPPAEAPAPPAVEPVVVAAPIVSPGFAEVSVATIPVVQPVMAEAAAVPSPASPAPHHAPRPGMRRLAEFAAELAEARRSAKLVPHMPPAPPSETPPGVVPLRQYALLRDIAGELRPRRVRARSGKRA